MSIKDMQCSQIKELKDIQDKKRVDSEPNNKHNDSEKVSCLQTHYKDKYGKEKEYNELLYIIDELFPDDKYNPELYKALCKCCKEKEAPKDSFRKILNGDKTQRDLFYECMELKRIDIELTKHIK